MGRQLVVALHGLVFLVKLLALEQVISGPLARTAGPRADFCQSGGSARFILATVGSFLPHLRMTALSRCTEKAPALCFTLVANVQ